MRNHLRHFALARIQVYGGHNLQGERIGGTMTSKHKAILVDWYSRVVFGVIALSLAMLAGQGACSLEPVARAQSGPCGSPDQPCFVRVLALEDMIQVNQLHRQQPKLRVHVVNQ
jgi:hypothetical protein